MTKRWTLLLGVPGLLVLPGLPGCRDLVGVDGKDFSAAPAGPASPTPLVPADTCTPLPAGGAALRFVQGAPVTGALDLCLETPGGPLTSVLRGRGCPGLLGYGQRSAPVRLPPGSYQARVTAGPDCQGAVLAQTGLVLAAGSRSEVLLAQGPAGLVLVALDEPAGAGLRLLDAVGGVDRAAVRTGDGARTLEAPALGASGRVAWPASASLELVEPATLSRVDGPMPTSATAVALGITGDEVYAPRLLVCDDATTAPRSDCRSSPLVSLTVDTLNNRFNPNDTYVPERLAALIAAVERSPADAVCLQELVYPRELRAQLAAAVAHVFPYAVHVTTTEQDPVTLAPPPTSSIADTPTCAPLSTEVADVLACITASCSTVPGSLTGELTSEQCFIDACGDKFQAYFKDYTSYVCSTCLRTAFTSGSLQQAADRCLLEPGLPLRLNGDNELLLVSRHPVEGAEMQVLPSTAARRLLLRAPISKPGAPPVDLYCTRLSTVFDRPQYVYHGLYGQGDTVFEQWQAEQRLQARIVSETIAFRSKQRRAALVGWMGASHPVMDGANLVIEGFAEGTLFTFEETLLDASTPAQSGQCTGCRANPLYGDSFFDRRPDHVYLRGFDPADVVSVDLAYDATDIVVTPSSISHGKSPIPISDHYGLRATVRLTR